MLIWGFYIGVGCVALDQHGTMNSGKRIKNYGKSPCSMGKSTISMVISNSYVSLREGNQVLALGYDVSKLQWHNLTIFFFDADNPTSLCSFGLVMWLFILFQFSMAHSLGLSTAFVGQTHFILVVKLFSIKLSWFFLGGPYFWTNQQLWVYTNVTTLFHLIKHVYIF